MIKTVTTATLAALLFAPSSKADADAKTLVAAASKALGAPRKLVGDTLAKANKKPKFKAVAEKRVLKNSTRTVEFYHIANMTHSDGMIAYLPKEKVLFQPDFTLPAPGQPADEFVVALAANLDRLNLWDFDRRVPVHAPNPDVLWTRADLRKAVGKTV